MGRDFLASLLWVWERLSHLPKVAQKRRQSWDLHSGPESSPMPLTTMTLVRLFIPKARAASVRVWDSESEAGPGVQALEMEVWTQRPSDGQRAGCQWRACRS